MPTSLTSTPAAPKGVDARLEEVLSTMEGLAATVFGRITDKPQ
jgi:hypothetical protein